MGQRDTPIHTTVPAELVAAFAGHLGWARVFGSRVFRGFRFRV